MIKECVEDLYKFRDHFFENHDVDKAEERATLIQQKLDETLVILQQISDVVKDKCTCHFLRGKALNVTATFDPQALECLSKAVKLNPKLVDAWNQLGDCYWKKGDIEHAKNCFTGALNHIKNKESLRSLSMVMRQLAVNQSNYIEIIRQSLDKAKEAVGMDMTDGTSWFILGNAYLSLFFAEGQNTTDLDRCFQAYTRAEKDPVAMGNPDLHQNKAVANQYNEEYQKSLDGYHKASCLDPGWKDPVNKETLIIEYLTQLTDLLNNRGRMKEKKLHTLSQSICDTDLGRYSGGSYTSQSGTSIKLDKTYFKHLKPGVNNEMVIVGKVISVLNTTSPLPTTFLLVDETGECFPVTVYNLSTKQSLKVTDSVAIPEPYLQTVQVNHKNKEFSFSSVRVPSPRVLVVNKKKLGADIVLTSTLAINTISQ